MKRRGAFITIIAVLGMALVSLVALAVLRPTDAPLLIGVVIAFITPTVTSLVALLKIEQVHGLVNSRMSELLALMRSQGQHEGREQEKQAVERQAEQEWQDTDDPHRRTLE